MSFTQHFNTFPCFCPWHFHMQVAIQGITFGPIVRPPSVGAAYFPTFSFPSIARPLPRAWILASFLPCFFLTFWIWTDWHKTWPKMREMRETLDDDPDAPSSNDRMISLAKDPFQEDDRPSYPKGALPLQIWYTAGLTCHLWCLISHAFIANCIGFMMQTWFARIVARNDQVKALRNRKDMWRRSYSKICYSVTSQTIFATGA